VTGQPSGGDRRPFRVLPWWMALIGAAVVAVSIFVTLRWLLPIAGTSPSLRIDAIKTGLSVGAGTGGAVALLLAVRRQWLSERTQAHAEEVARTTQAHAEQVALSSAHDATQRRITDLYGKAVEQLGHANAAVRLGGLYSLERLAQDHAEHRQTVIDVICAYLRMPFQVPGDMGADLGESAGQEVDAPVAGARLESVRDDAALQELQVRLAAQRILTRHLTISADDVEETSSGARSGPHWPDARIDLNGAVLVDFDFSGCRMRRADFADARFSGDAWFRGARFSRSAWFHRARFSGDAWFDSAKFSGDATFDEAKFSGIVRFERAKFSKTAWFGGAQFSQGAGFNRAQFERAPDFKNAQASYADEYEWPAGWRVEPSSSDTPIGRLIQDQVAMPDTKPAVSARTRVIDRARQ
jgi:uncharacterized protein YjbI with pentapeptide repeats